MQNRIKPILSFLCISFFLVFALSSAFLKESSNIFVEPQGCANEPVVAGSLTIHVQYEGNLLSPTAGAECKIFIVHELVDNDECKASVVSSETITLYLDANGECTYVTPPFVHDNSQDLFRVDVKVNTKNILTLAPSFQKMEVTYYDSYVLNIYKLAPIAL